MPRARTLVLVLLAALTVVACARGRRARGSRYERQLRTQAALELGCAAQSLQLTALNDRVYQVHGCSQLRDYALGGTGRRAGWYAIQPVYLRASSEMACPVDRLAIAAPTATLRSAEGCGRTARYDLVCGAIECAWLMTAHAGQWAGETQSTPIATAAVTTTGGEATVAVAPGDPAIASGVAPGDPAITSAATTASPASASDEVAIPEPPRAGSPEAVVRAMLDARRDGVHRCAGVGTVPVHATWDADGALTLALDPPHAGSDVERCVRAAIGAQHVPPGTPGELVHPVR